MHSLFLYGLSEHIIKNPYMLTRLEMHGEPLSGVNVAKQIIFIISTNSACIAKNKCTDNSSAIVA